MIIDKNYSLSEDILTMQTEPAIPLQHIQHHLQIFEPGGDVDRAFILMGDYTTLNPSTLRP